MRPPVSFSETWGLIMERSVLSARNGPALGGQTGDLFEDKAVVPGGLVAPVGEVGDNYA